MPRPSGLGKGLSAIIPESTSLSSPGAGATGAAGGADADAFGAGGGAGLLEIPTASVSPNRRQPRLAIADGPFSELVASVREVGVLQPILVRPKLDGGYELLAGERRWRAATEVGLASIPALVRDVDDIDALGHAIVENVQREDLHSIEEALAYTQLVEEFGLTQEEVATLVGRSRSAIANTVRLLQLPPEIQRRVAEGDLTAGHARALLGTDDADFQRELAAKITNSSLTVRQIEDSVRAHRSEATSNPSEPASKRPAAIVELERLLGERLSTRVVIRGGAGKGRIEIQFADVDDLERLTRLLT